MRTAVVIAVTAVVTYLVSALIRALTSHEKKIDHRIEQLYCVEDEQFLRSIGSLLPPGILGGNRVTTLINGREIFPAMLEAIGQARKTIVLETFIYWSGEVGRKFAEALSDRARGGVKVHVLLDWLGSKKMEEQLLEEMKKAGVEVERYHPIRWWRMRRLNNRTHRKLLVVDGRIGFTGGVGIADPWDGDAHDPEHWRDTHYRIEGPVVAQVQAAFMDNWLKTRSEVLHGEEYFPKLKEEGNPEGCRAQLFMSSASEGSESARLMYLLSIASAKESVRIESAYFVPDDLSVRTLVDARKRGVEVEIIVPGKHIDTQLVRRASRSRWGALLEAGARIYEYQPAMFHCKVMVVDGLWTSVGSSNFDNRSFRLNDEANLNVYDREFAGEQVRVFEKDKGKARQVTLEEWKNRPWREKAMERLAGLLRSQL